MSSCTGGVGAPMIWCFRRSSLFRCPRAPTRVRSTWSATSRTTTATGRWRASSTARDGATAHGLVFTRDLVFDLRRYHGIPAQPDGTGDASDMPLAVGEAARELGVQEATLYRWVRAGLVPVVDPVVDGAPLRVRMSDALRARFRPEPPEGFVPVATAMRCLGVTRQTIWNRAKAGTLRSCHVTHGSRRGSLCRGGGR